MKRDSLAIILVSLLPCLAQAKDPKAAGATGAQQAVEKVDDDIFDAAKKGDAEAFGKLLADDYVRIGPDGKAHNKAESVDLYKSGRLKWESIDLKSRTVRVFGNTAIVNREDDVKGKIDDTEISGAYRDTIVYVKGKNGQWRDVNFQSTKVRP